MLASDQDVSQRAQPEAVTPDSSSIKPMTGDKALKQ
jgi:hypothetical protein